MRTAPFTKTIRTAQKVLLIDRRENHRVGSMRHLVFKRRLPDGTPLGVLFQPHTLYRRSEIPPRAQPLVEIREVRLKILFIRLLPDLVDPGRLVRGPVKRLAQHLHIHQVYHREDPIRVLDRLLCKLLKFCGYGWRPTARYARLRLPCSGSRGPEFPALPIGASGLRPSVLCSAKTAICPSRVASLPVAPRYPACSPAAAWPPFGSQSAGCPPTAPGRCSPGRPVSGIPVKETDGSPKFPSYPFAHMPRTQTPVVSNSLAFSACWTAAFRHTKTSAFPPQRKLSCTILGSGGPFRRFRSGPPSGSLTRRSTTIEISRLHLAAYMLATPCFRLPLTADLRGRY